MKNGPEINLVSPNKSDFPEINSAIAKRSNEAISAIIKEGFAKNKTAIAKEIGLNTSRISSIKPSNMLRLHHIYMLYNTYNISLHWLITGEGHMFISTEENVDSQPDVRQELDILKKQMAQLLKKEG